MNSDHCPLAAVRVVVTDSPRAAIAGDRPRPHRGRAASRPRLPRLRGVRRAAGHHDPARRLPARQHPAVASASWPSASTSPARPCARRWPRCARPGWSRPGAAAAAARSSPSSRVRRRRARPHGITEASATRVARLPGLPAHRRAGRREPGRARSSSTTPPWPSSTRRTQAVAERPPAGRAPAGRLPLPPDDRGADRVAARWSRRSPRVQATLHEMLLAIPVLDANIAHSDRQHAALVRGDPAGQPRPGPRGHGGTLRRHRRAAARPAGLDLPG